MEEFRKTLSQLILNSRIVRGLYFMRSLFFRYTVRKTFEEKPYKVSPYPPLPLLQRRGDAFIFIHWFGLC